MVDDGWPRPTDSCAQITSGCYDTFQDTQISFKVALSPPPVVWIISQGAQAADGTPEGDSYLGACGAPWLLVHQKDLPSCVRIHGIAANGAVSTSERYCASSAPGTADASNSTMAVASDAGTSSDPDAGTAVDPYRCPTPATTQDVASEPHRRDRAASLAPARSLSRC